jgi:hypothetical protein
LSKKEVDCEYFLPYSKKCSAPTENESPPGYCIECIHPQDPRTCRIKKRYEDEQTE